MVFAREKMTIEDICFYSEPGTVELRYVGPKPLMLYDKCAELLKTVWNVPHSQIQEVKTSWGKSSDKEKVECTWWVFKDMDVFSYLMIRINFKAEGAAESGKGFLNIKGYMRTEYPQDTIWQRSILYEMVRTFWHRVFYRRKREEYAEECRHSIIYYEKLVKEYMEKLKRGEE